jgi:hypothetical protein
MTVYQQTVNVGSSFEQTYLYRVGDRPFNLAGWGAIFRLRDQADTVVSTVRYGDTGDRSLVIDSTTGSIDVTIVASATEGLAALRTGTFELEIYELMNPGRVFRIVDGSVAYRPRGRAMLDNRVCVISASSNQVVVETQAISSYMRIDRGPPGAQGSAALDNALPTIEEDPAIGSSSVAPKADRQYGLALSNRHGFMRMEDKAAHDILWLQEVVIYPSGDLTGATDQSALDAALADTSKSTRLSPGTFYLDGGSAARMFAVDMRSRYGARLTGAGATCTIVNYVGPRIAGRRLIGLDNAVNCVVEGIEFHLADLEGFAYQRLIIGQPTGNVIRGNHVYGNPSGIHTTSTSSVTIGTGAKALTVAAGKGSVLVNGSTAMAVSRSTGAYVYGAVTYSGTSLTITVSDAKHTRGSGAHTDWDIRTPAEGVFCAADAECVVEHNRFNWLYYSYWNDGGFGGRCVDNFYSSFNAIGTPYHLGGSASRCLIRGPNEPDVYGWSTLADIRDTLRCEVDVNTGDNGAFGPIVNVVNGKGDRVHGMFWDGPGNTSAAINAVGSTGLSYGGTFATPYLIDFGSGATNSNPRLEWYDTIGTGVIGIWTGSSVGGAGYQIADNADGRRWEGKVRYDEAKIGFIVGCSQATVATILNGSSQRTLFSGITTLVAGVSPVVAAPNIGAGSRIIVTVATPNTIALTATYAALPADRVNGAPGSFIISALTTAGAVNGADVSSVEFLVINT